MHRLKDLIGIPFVKGGRDPKVGLDCLGLARIIFDRLEKGSVPGGYVNEDDSDDVGMFIFRSMEDWEPIDQPEVGCAVAMRLDPDRPDLAQHLGVYIGEGYILQTTKRKGVHRIHIEDPLFCKKIAGFYRYKGK